VCGRYVSATPPDLLSEQFEAQLPDPPPIAEPRWNVAPGTDVYAVATSRSSGSRRLGRFRWGLVPNWARDRSIANRLINARAESILTRPAFRRTLARRRCILPADAFYEWKRRPGGRSEPFLVRRRDGDLMALAGLWEVWWEEGQDRATAEPLRTCAIVTTRANGVVGAIHDRMPVVLERSEWDVWLDPAIEDVDELRGLLVPLPDDEVEMLAVGQAVNDVRNEGPELIEPIGS